MNFFTRDDWCWKWNVTFWPALISICRIRNSLWSSQVVNSRESFTCLQSFFFFMIYWGWGNDYPTQSRRSRIVFPRSHLKSSEFCSYSCSRAGQVSLELTVIPRALILRQNIWSWKCFEIMARNPPDFTSVLLSLFAFIPSIFKGSLNFSISYKETFPCKIASENEGERST